MIPKKSKSRKAFYRRALKAADPKWTKLLMGFCAMHGFKFEWFVSDSPSWWHGCKQHCLCIANEGGTFEIRHIKEITYPGTNMPTYITSTWITPTYDSLEKVCKKICETSFGKWWTGNIIDKTCIPNVRTRCALKFPVNESELKLKLAINGF